MIKNKTVEALADAKLVDKALVEWQTILETELSWLTKAYGRVVRRVEEIDGREVFFPAIEAGGVEYIKMWPDSSKGNFSYFDLEGRIDISDSDKGEGVYRLGFGFVIWYDIRKVYSMGSDWKNRNIMNVIDDVRLVFDRKAAVQSVIRWSDLVLELGS
jgi:hypothetical protein